MPPETAAPAPDGLDAARKARREAQGLRERLHAAEAAQAQAEQRVGALVAAASAAERARERAELALLAGLVERPFAKPEDVAAALGRVGVELAELRGEDGSIDLFAAGQVLHRAGLTTADGWGDAKRERLAEMARQGAAYGQPDFNSNGPADGGARDGRAERLVLAGVAAGEREHNAADWLPSGAELERRSGR